jgi:ATP-dependent RNA helicase DDX51/DBP6
MYARYIPPARTGNNSNSSIRDPSEELRASSSGNFSAPAPQKVVFSEEDPPKGDRKKRRREEIHDGVADGREKRPRKSKSTTQPPPEENNLTEEHQKQSENDNSLTAAADTVQSSQRKEEKKEKKRKKDERAGGNAESIREQDSTSNGPHDPAQALKTRDKKKKKKKKDKESNTAQDGDVESDDEIRKKHRGVFERKEKALRSKPVSSRAEELAIDGSAAETTKVEDLHGLEPLPQPEPVNLDDVKPAYETLPPWLANPVRVTSSTKSSFADLGISNDAAKVLAAKGYKTAFAVQTAAIPLLIPSVKVQGDVVISAATGSGKTLAYVLPMVRDISQGTVTRLRGLIVVPTRELVRQAQEACELCAQAFSGAGRKRVKIAISMGSQSFKQEQSSIMEEQQVYDPEGFARWMKKNKSLDLDEPDEEDSRHDILDTTKPLPDHIVQLAPKVDILICTPGRLVDHINQTRGFTLDYVRWLVVDEADKLLAQSYQQWLDVVMDKLSTMKPGARDFPGSNKTGIRKVILSATMTRDLSLLNGLKLRRPQLIILEGSGLEADAEPGVEGGEHVIPDQLRESVIKVRASNLKPLYLMDLLNSKHLVPINMNKKTAADVAEPSSESSSSDAESDTDSEDDSTSQGSEAESKPKSRSMPLRAAILIFTKSNEAALRLSRLLTIISPSLEPIISTLTSNTPTSQRRRTLQAFTAGRLRVLVASDLVARGLDLPALDHVVNYDVPTSAASYVHRVGRTARAGRAGHAWTLVTNSEAGWFWHEVGGEGKGRSVIQRSAKVNRVRLGGDEENSGWFNEETVQKYEDALERLGKEAGDMRRWRR